MRQNSRKALIIGAGIAGPTTAIFLKQAGIDSNEGFGGSSALPRTGPDRVYSGSVGSAAGDRIGRWYVLFVPPAGRT